ncbi:uncharacterized protein LOC122958360 [Acropora millepora]|uniref:uncharacterized protein LOC122958360 n=1 Tax=Acropora millepora TaxID=45264 RepID=UPI001CF5C144|nr:uncharacterized protein LOC122958360 [Acropora millepora]
MPNTTINSLKKENDKLKDEITALRKSFGELQQLLQRHDEPPPNNGGHICSLNAETSTNLEFYGKSYDDLKVAQAEADTRLQQLWSRLDALTARVEEMSIALEQFQRYSYQYNIKILGLPETTTHESASETSEMCLNLFKAVGVDISIRDIDIAHRIPTRNSTPGPRPVICKFTRRVIKEQVMNKRKDACKISSTSIGLAADCSLEEVRLFDHLTPRIQQLLADVKKFQMRNGYRFCWSKNFIVYLRQTEDSRPILIKSQSDLENFAQREGLPLS